MRIGMGLQITRPYRNPGFFPDSIPGLAAWYDARRTGTLTLRDDGGTKYVAAMADLSGQSGDRSIVQPEAALQPIYIADAFGEGRPGIRHPESITAYLIGSAGVLTATADAPGATVLVSLKYRVTTAVRRIVDIATTVSGSRRIGLACNTTGRINAQARRVEADSPTNLNSGNNAIVDNTAFVQTLQVNTPAGTLAQFANNTAAGSTTLASSGNFGGTSHSMIIGAGLNLGAALDGDWQRILIYRRVLTTTEREDIVGLLAAGVGVSL